jgi:DNA-directed RNA polymerase subunit RPC12/RpoP
MTLFKKYTFYNSFTADPCLHFNSIVYPCNQCPAQFFKHAALRHHSLICPNAVTDVKNVEKEYKCLECGKIFSNYRKFYHHTKIHEGIIYRCVQCPSTYKSKSGIKRHLRTQHELWRFECHHCQNYF